MASLKQQIQHFLLQENGRTPRIPVFYTLSTKIHTMLSPTSPTEGISSVYMFALRQLSADRNLELAVLLF